jgi:hypothetical protein
MKAYLSFTVFLVLGVPFSVKSQQPLVASIDGTIKNQQGQPIPYASLSLTNIDSVEAQSTRQEAGSDQQGRYEFVEVPEGRYALTVKKNGYQDYTIPLLSVYPGQRVRMPVIKLSAAAPPHTTAPAKP